MSDMVRFEVVGFDADDTLWRSEDHFTEAEALFAKLVSPYAVAGVDVQTVLHEVELANIAISGYGVKAYGLSMVQAAVRATNGTVPSSVLGDLVDHVHTILLTPVELISGVAEVLAALAGSYRIILITKGDLVHQHRKVDNSGLEHFFEHIEVVLEKNVSTYQRILQRQSIEASTFLMVGNSVKSDILPVLSLGGHGVHIPYHATWSHEVVDSHQGGFAELESITQLPGWLAAR